MIGAIIGDIVGSRFEFNNAKGGNFALFTKQCDFTDDTICTVAVADQFWDNTMEICESVMCQYYGEDWERHLPPRGKFDETCQGCVPLAFHIVKESRSFEDAIRKAILYGGDSDTLGAIVGSLAEAYFVVDPAMIQTAMSYLPEDMQNVIRKFNATYR